MSPEWHRGLVRNSSVCSEKAIIMMTFSTPGFTTSVNLNLFVFFGDLFCKSIHDFYSRQHNRVHTIKPLTEVLSALANTTSFPTKFCDM